MLDNADIDSLGVFCSVLGMLEAPLKVRLLLKLDSERDDREKEWVILDRTWRARDDLEVFALAAVGCDAGGVFSLSFRSMSMLVGLTG
jgi:hypothetical protein